MAGRGRKPKPTALHKLDGNPSKIPDLDDRVEPSFAPLSHDCPTSVGAYGREVWIHLAPMLTSMGLLNDGSVHAFGELCFWIGLCREYREARAQVNGDEGPENVKHDVQRTRLKREQDPAIKNLIAATEQARKWMSEFGLTPSSLARLGVVDYKPQRDDFDEWNDPA